MGSSQIRNEIITANVLVKGLKMGHLGWFQGDSKGDGCSSAWTLGKFWALRAAMRLQRVRTVGGRGESRYLRGHRERQQAWGEGAWEGVHQPARLGPSAHEAQFHGNSVIK